MIEEECEKIPKKRGMFECEKCGSTFTYFRIKDNSIVCRRCGHVTKLKRINQK